jgi:hypothetical protein
MLGWQHLLTCLELGTSNTGVCWLDDWVWHLDGLAKGWVISTSYFEDAYRMVG